MSSDECRSELFRERGHEVLGSVVQGTQMAQPDPFDVDEIHAEARAAFDSTLRQVRQGPVSKILLIRGEAGCGKTHLIRSLRAQTHAQRAGVIAYVHMTAEQTDYRQYLLRQVIKSLSDRYVAGSDSSALELISDAMAASGQLPPDAAEKLHEADDATMAELVTQHADQLIEIEGSNGAGRFAEVDLNTLRIFLYRQSNQKPIRRRVSSFLNGESLSDMDWKKLAAMPRDCDRGAIYLLTQLARVTQAALGVPLIVCVDQIENSDITGTNHEPFQRAMSTACELIETVPGMMVLLSCLDSAYNVHAPSLIQAFRHRIENDPRPALLTAARSADEIRQIVSRRLKWLYEGEGLEHVPANSVYPMPEDVPERLQRQTLRMVLQTVHDYWEKCSEAPAGVLPAWVDGEKLQVLPEEKEVDVDRLRIKWNEFLTAGGNAVSEDDDAQFALLTWALNQIPQELDERTSVTIQQLSARRGHAPTPCLAIVIQEPRTPSQHRLVGLCDKDPRGGGLDRQIQTMESLHEGGDQRMVFIRSTPFPKRGKVSARLNELDKSGHVRAVVEDPVWQSMRAMQRFLPTLAGFPPRVVKDWRRTDQPLVRLRGISAIVQITKPAAAKEDPKAPANEPKRSAAAVDAPRPVLKSAPPKSAPAKAVPTVVQPKAAEKKPAAIAPASPLVIGTSDGLTTTDITIDPQLLTRHTAIFGANGSGKTVLALTILEMLLERGIPAILFDRKGDLACYAKADAWEQTTGAPAESARRAALRERASVHLYTPGCLTGRPLVLPLLPSGLGKLSKDDRTEVARQAALILCDVCDPRSKAAMFTAVLANTIGLFCLEDSPRTLDELQDVLLNPPSDLLQNLPAHTEKDCAAVGRRLSERRIAYGRLFSDQGEKLDLRRMLSPDDGRVRLNIISTQFLDADASLVWIAQFLAAAGQFINVSPAPDGRLQAVLMFDEADQYVPAMRKPATKPGMENLLRRARGAGVGIMLATQNVGDFDYKALDNITTIFAGKMPSQRAMEKLRSRFDSATDRIAKKSMGQFLMGAEKVICDMKAFMCLVKPTPVPRDEIERIAASQAID